MSSKTLNFKIPLLKRMASIEYRHISFEESDEANSFSADLESSQMAQIQNKPLFDISPMIYTTQEEEVKSEKVKIGRAHV